MNSASMTFGRPTRLAAPRGSIWMAGLVTAMIDGLRRLDSWQLNQQRNEPKTVEGVLNWARHKNKFQVRFTITAIALSVSLLKLSRV